MATLMTKRLVDFLQQSLNRVFEGVHDAELAKAYARSLEVGFRLFDITSEKQKFLVFESTLSEHAVNWLNAKG